MNIEAIAQAIEADAGIELPALRESLAEMHIGISGRTTTINPNQCRLLKIIDNPPDLAKELVT